MEPVGRFESFAGRFGGGRQRQLPVTGTDDDITEFTRLVDGG